jgi:Undecaprenyl-phosphate galactose phosphotransferase WbaP
LIDNPHLPALSSLIIQAGDAAVLAFGLSIFLKVQAGMVNLSFAWLHVWPLLTLFLVLHCICGVYPGVNVGPVDDIRRISTGSVGAFLVVSLLLGFGGAPLRLQLLWLLSCTSISIALATLRSAVRHVGSKFDWWGYPVAIFGSGDAARALLCKLRNYPEIGFHPIAVVSDHVRESKIENVPVCRFDHMKSLLECGVKHVIIAAPELSQTEFASVLERGSDLFPHMIIIPDTDVIWKSGSYTRDLMGMLGLHVGNNLLRAEARAAKRAIDLGFCLLLIPPLLVLTAVIAALIAIESGFPVLYSQKRLGHDGRVFHIWKFRTMVRNAAEVLEFTLASDPELRKDWIANQKLRNDPRITRVGKILRKTSLDELPQLWNVIKGEMSLVGPRPIVHDEIARYKEAYAWYAKTTPGVTGLWQVSGRSRTTYQERVAYDTYYVKNWSIWLDIYLLAKTVSVIFTGDGAY